MSNPFPERKILPVRSRRSLGGERRSVSNTDQGQLSTPPIFGNSLRVAQPPDISPPVSLEHKILPTRLRRSLDQPGERQDPFSILWASASSQPVERPIETTPASSDFSPPRSNSAVASNVTSSKAGSSLSSNYEGNGFDFKGLEFGRQPTLQPDAMKPPPIPDSQTRSSDLSLPILSRLEQEDPQPLHVLFSDEKIVVPTENEGLGMPIPVLLNGNSASAEYGPSTPPPRRTSLFSQRSELGTSPSLYPHGRSVSVSSSISDVSYYNDLTSPYDVGTEEPPLEPFFASPFQTALQQGLNIAKDAADAMETAGQSLVAGGDLQRLINDAKELSTFKSSETRTIAVLGDSGEGKDTSR